MAFGGMGGMRRPGMPDAVDPGQMQPPEGFDPSRMTPPEGFEMPDGMEPPEGFDPSQMTPPEGFEMPDGMQPPEGFEMPGGERPQDGGRGFDRRGFSRGENSGEVQTLFVITEEGGTYSGVSVVAE